MLHSSNYLPAICYVVGWPGRLHLCTPVAVNSPGCQLNDREKSFDVPLKKYSRDVRTGPLEQEGSHQCCSKHYWKQKTAVITTQKSAMYTMCGFHSKMNIRMTTLWMSDQLLFHKHKLTCFTKCKNRLPFCWFITCLENLFSYLFKTIYIQL